jgi:hypothetical protein
MTHLSARLADALTPLPCDAFVQLSLMWDSFDDAAGDLHDRVMSSGSAASPSADSSFLMHTMIGSWCSACDPVARWQTDPGQPTLHLRAKGFGATDGVLFLGAAQVDPVNSDITPNERSGR